jgi:hypothetical protein
MGRGIRSRETPALPKQQTIQRTIAAMRAQWPGRRRTRPLTPGASERTKNNNEHMRQAGSRPTAAAASAASAACPRPLQRRVRPRHPCTLSRKKTPSKWAAAAATTTAAAARDSIRSRRGTTDSSQRARHLDVRRGGGNARVREMQARVGRGSCARGVGRAAARNLTHRAGSSQPAGVRAAPAPPRGTRPAPGVAGPARRAAALHAVRKTRKPGGAACRRCSRVSSSPSQPAARCALRSSTQPPPPPAVAAAAMA